MEASIPVNLFNPGQVLACMGFLEAADALAGDAESRFDWNDVTRVHFQLRARGHENPFGRVLSFLAACDIRRYAPPGYIEPPPKNKTSAADDDDAGFARDATDCLQTFPGPKADVTALPIRLVGSGSWAALEICIGHWADSSSRSDFKLYSGNRSAAGIARAMLDGTREKPTKRGSEGDVRTRGLKALWSERASELQQDPFGVVTPIGGSFNFDPRGAWTTIDAGYSPNDQKHGVFASPVVEILAAIGLEHARPDEYETRRVRYAVWGCFLPPLLARPVLAGASLPVPKRLFSFDLALAGKNKVITFAREETTL